jgi:hypothetical protein
MHAIRFQSPRQCAARLCAKRDHSDPRGTTKADFRRRKRDRRDFRQEIALCIWGASSMHAGVEL